MPSSRLFTTFHSILTLFIHIGFNEVAERLDAVFEENKVYMVEGAQIKPIKNRNFNTTDHNYELTFYAATKVQEVVEGASRDVPSTLYKFKKISELASKPEKEKVDVIGVILEVQDLQNIVTRAGRQTKKREIQITDTSNCTIKVTLWGDKAERFSPTDSIHKILAIKGAEISEWQGKSLNCGFTATFEIDPKICQEADILREWFDGDGVNATSTQTLSQSIITLPISANTELITLAEVKQSLSSNVADIVKYFTVEASLINIKHDNVMYRACPNDTCRRKVTEDPQHSAEYKCQKCDKKYPNFNWRYSLQGAIADFSDFHWVTVFEESGQSIVGMSADQLARKKDRNVGEFEMLLNNCKYVPYRFILKSKVETWNDEKRLRLNIVKAAKVDRTDEHRTRQLKSEIESLKILLGR